MKSAIPFSHLRAQLKRRRWNREVPAFVSRPHKGRRITKPHARPPMSAEQRTDNYLFQVSRLTPRQVRRILTKANRRIKMYGSR